MISTSLNGRTSAHPHILTLSPPLDMRPQSAETYLAHTMAKKGMSVVTRGLAEELQDAGVGFNSLWPRTTIPTAAITNLLGGADSVRHARTTQNVPDEAHAILTRDPRSRTGNFLIDEDVERYEGVNDLEQYRAAPGSGPLEPDLFLEPLEISA
jgi:citronellol/citronellal dehydrogenase